MTNASPNAATLASASRCVTERRNSCSSHISMISGMGAEDGALQPEVGVDVDHAAVVVAQQSHAVAAHAAGDLRRVDPPVDLGPGLRVVEVARHHVVFGAGAVEYRTEFGQRTGLAVGKPLAVISPRSDMPLRRA